MQSKIEWYQEVLSLEPGSKVFFPLAKLYVEIGETDRAVNTLKHGLDRHPDFLEARLMLVDLLVRLDKVGEARRHIDHVTEPMAAHPAFWKLWAQHVKGANKDLAVFLMLVASNLTSEEIKWSDVVMEGLYNLSERLVGDVEPEEAIAEMAPPDLGSDLDNELNLEPPDLDEPGSGEAGPACQGKGIRTRTMADLLATQGDYRAALDIYRERLGMAASEREKEDLEERIERMQVRLAEAGETAVADEENVFGKHAKNRLLSTLETLAARFEARVRS